MQTYSVEIGGHILEIERDLDGKFIIPDRFRGTGTSLKPAFEPIVLARKPLSEKTVAANVLRWGTGALNIDGCRVESGGEKITTHSRGNTSSFAKRPREKTASESGRVALQNRPEFVGRERTGRWPANVVHDGSDEVVGAFPTTTTTGKRTEQSKSAEVPRDGWLMSSSNVRASAEYTDSGSAARFFYSAKASKADRDEGLDEFEESETAAMQGNLTSGQRLAGNGTPIATPRRKNTHPTVKPTSLMSWLCRLITPPGGTVLDPFMGSGSTGKAAVYEGFKFIGCEREDEYIKIAEARIAYACTAPLPVAPAVAEQPAMTVPANDNLPRDLFDEVA